MVPLEYRTAERGLDNVLSHYNRSGFFTKKNNFDGEFKSIMDEVADNLDKSMNYENPDDRVPDIDRNN